MKRFLMAVLATATILTGSAAADAQRGHDRGHNYHRDDGRRGNHYNRGHRRDRDWGRHQGRRSYYYYRHGRRYQGWR